MSTEERREAPGEVSSADRAPEWEEPEGAGGDRPAGEPGGEEEESPRRSRRRRGCGCLLRLPVYLVLLVILAVAGLYLWSRTDSANSKALGMLEARLSEYFDRDVEVGAVEWTLWPISLTATDLVIPSPGEDTPPFARVGRIDVWLGIESWADWREPVLDVQRVTLEEPLVYLELREDGTNNLPRFGRDERTGGRRVEVRLGAIRVNDGRFRLNELELPLDLVARTVEASLEGAVLEGEPGDEEAAGLVLDGRFEAEELEIEPPGGERYSAGLSARVRIGPRLVELERIELRGPDLTAVAKGELIIPEEERRLALSLVADGRIAVADRLGYLDTAEVPVEGPFHFDGSLLWSPMGWSVEGLLSSARLTYERRVLTDVQGVLRVVPEALRYRIDHAEHAGGTVSGVVAADLEPEEPAFEIDLSTEGLSLAALAQDQDLPLEGLHGRIGGEISYRFTADAAAAGSGWADLSVRSATGGPVTEGLALTGQVPLEIDSGTLRTSAVRLATASGDQLIEVEGSYDIPGGRGSFDYRLDTQDVGTLAALMPEGEPEEGPPAWLPTEGRGEAEGTFRIGPEGWSVSSAFELTGVETPGLVAERVDGSLRVGPEGVRELILEASRDEGALMVVGSIPFEEGPPGDGRAPPFDLQVDFASWPVNDRLLEWLPIDQEELPVEGDLSGHLALGGTLEAITGEAQVTVEPVTLAGNELDRVEADLRFDPERVVIERAVAQSAAGPVRARGTVELGTGRLDLQAEAPRLLLAEEPFASLLRGDVQGELGVGLTVGGTLEQPRVEAVVEGRDLVIAGTRVGDDGLADLRLVWEGDELTAEGGISGLLTVGGGGALNVEGADLTVQIASDRLGEVLRAVAPEVPEGLGGEVSGELVVRGAFADPEELLMRVELQRLLLSYENRTVRNVEPVVARLAGDELVVDSLFVEEVDTESELFAQGSVGLGETNPLDLRIQGSLSTDWIELVAPEVEMSGTFDVLATVGGTLAEPAVNGQGELHDGEVILSGFPQSFEEVHAIVLFYPDQVVLDTLETRVGDGSVRAFGRASLYGPEGLDYRLQATVDDVTLRSPDGFWFRTDAALTLMSTPDGRVVRGTVTVDRAFYLQDVETGMIQIMRQALRTERLEVAEVDEFAASTQLALSVEAPPGSIRVRNNVADLRGSADLTVRGTAARPVVFGTVEFQPGGTLEYAENEFQVERARLSFVSPARLEPVIDLVATTEVREYDVTLDLSGKIENLQVSVSSDPPLSDLDVVSLLATGQTRGGARPGEPGTESAGGAAGAFLAGQAYSAVADRVGTLFGFDKLRLAPDPSSSRGSGGGLTFTVAKRLSKNVIVTFTDPGDTSEEVNFLQVEWQVDENLTLVFSNTTEDSFRVDARWERRF